MRSSKKAIALAGGLFAALSIAALAQNPSPGTPSVETLPVDDATVEWIEKSDVAALREGVVEKMELQIGMPVRAGGVIGKLHDEIATLTMRKAEVAVASTAAQAKAVAQRELAIAVVATSKRLNERKPGMVSREEMQKNEAEVKVAHALYQEALEKLELDKAELALAKRARDEHTILAPFDGVVLERYKHPGESVRANEPVIRLGNIDKLRVWAYIPIEHAFRVKEGQIVELQPKLTGMQGVPAGLDRKRIRGKITYVDPQVQAIGENAVQISAEFDNKDRALRPGLKASLTIYLTPEGQDPEPTIEARTAPGGLGR